jgi:hypothetical protein
MTTELRTDAAPLVAGVLDVLGRSGLLGWRAHRHPGRACAVAVRGVFVDAYGDVLEAAGYTVERCGGWLTVSTR